MEGFSPKIEIINYFDNLISRVDIDIDQCLEKYNEDQVLNQLNFFDIGKRNKNGQSYIFLKYFDLTKPIQHQTVDEWPESTKVVDYLNQIRMRTIDELTKAQEENLEYYKQNLTEFKSNSHQFIGEMNMDELRSEIFKEKFYFQVVYKPDDPKYEESTYYSSFETFRPIYGKPWIFNLFTFVTDFYMSQTDITLLEKFINSPDRDVRDRVFPDLQFFLDEKMVLITLLQKHFFDNLKTQKFPSHVIIVRKQDILNVKEICCNCFNGVNLSSTTIDLSNLQILYLSGKNPKEIKIEGLSSLESLTLYYKSLKQVIVKNLFALKILTLFLETPIDSEFLFKFNDCLPNIELLILNGNLSYFSLDSLSNLKTISINGRIMYDFNFGLFDRLCNQLEHITISGGNFDDKCLEKLFYGRNFPYLNKLNINNTLIIKLEKKLFDGLQMLRKLQISENKQLRIIDSDAFSNLIRLEELFIADAGIEFIDKTHFSKLINLKKFYLGYRIKAIEENCFSSLHCLEYLNLESNQLISLDSKSFVGLNNLKELNLNHNKLTKFDLKMFDSIGKIEEIYLYGNPIINKEEIFNLSEKSKIKVCI